MHAKENIKIVLFRDSEKSFLESLDVAGIKHDRINVFSVDEPISTGIFESISAFSEAMPWNSVAKVIVAWLEAKKSRVIYITTKDEKVIYLKGYSIKDVKKTLPKSDYLSVIDTEEEIL